MNSMGPMGGGVQNPPAPPYRQPGGKPGNSNVMQQNHMQQVSKLYV